LLSGLASNTLIYATSNCRRLLPEFQCENQEAPYYEGEHLQREIHRGDSVEEKTSLSERLGLWLSFHLFTQIPRDRALLAGKAGQLADRLRKGTGGSIALRVGAGLAQWPRGSAIRTGLVGAVETARSFKSESHNIQAVINPQIRPFLKSSRHSVTFRWGFRSPSRYPDYRNDGHWEGLQIFMLGFSLVASTIMKYDCPVDLMCMPGDRTSQPAGRR
jgi:hypothetical protein